MVSTPSSSTLSPLAPPFTVDRPSPAHRFHPYCYAPSPPPPPPRPPLIGDSLTTDFDRNTLFDRQDSYPSGSAGETSSWIDPSFRYGTAPFQKGGTAEGFLAYRDGYGSWAGKHFDSSARQLLTGSDSIAWGGEGHPDTYEEKADDQCDNMLSYFHLPDPSLLMNECNNSATCASSAQIYTSANGTSSSVYSSAANGFSTTQDRSLLYKVDDNYVDHMLSKKIEPFPHEYSDGKQGYMKGNMANNDMKGNMGSANSSGGDKANNTNSMDYSAEVKYEQLKPPDSYASSSESNSSLQTSPEILDQPYPAVDSPCWKGAMLSQRCPFGGGEMIDCYPVLKEPKGSDNFDQGHSHLTTFQTFPQYSRAPSGGERDGGLSCHGVVRETSSSQGDLSPNIILAGEDRGLYFSTKGSGRAEVEKETKSHSFIVGGNFNQRGRSPEKDYEGIDKIVKQLGQEGSSLVSEDISIPEDKGTHAGTSIVAATNVNSPNLNLNTSNHVKNLGIIGGPHGQVIEPKDSTLAQVKSSGKDLLLLANAIYGLSEVLLSSSYNGVAEIKECDAVARKAINNLETFLLKNKKAINECSSHAPGHETAGLFQAPVSKSTYNVKAQNTSSEETTGNFHGMKSNKFDGWSFNGTSQPSVKVTMDNILDTEEENPQAELYKNLWMQAEASLCSMKYELQLVRMKLEAENHKPQTIETKPVPLTTTPVLGSVRGLDILPCKNRENSSHADKAAGEKKSNQDKEPEGSIISRLEILKARYDRSNNSISEDQPKGLDAENSLKDLPAKLADLGFVDSGVPQPFSEDGYGDVHSSLAKAMLTNRQLLAEKYFEENNGWYETIRCISPLL